MLTSFRRLKNLVAFGLAAVLVLIFGLTVPTTSSPQAPPAWIVESNQNAQVLVEAVARFLPEGAGQWGVNGLDDQILDLKPGFVDRQKQTAKDCIGTLRSRLTKARDPRVRQDLEILINAAQDTLDDIELGDKAYLPSISVVKIVYGGVQSLLDDQVAPDRRAKALVRLKKYVGLEKGYTPLTTLAQQHTQKKLQIAGLRGPIKSAIEDDLTASLFLYEGIGQLFEKYKIQGYKPAYAQLKEQLLSYDTFVRKNILPKSRSDFRMPPELYALSLKKRGVEISPAQLATIGHIAFTQVQQKMQALAPLVAKQKGFKTTDYRQVIQLLKKEQLAGKKILPHYQARIKEVEQIIQREKLVTLPRRSMRVRLATEAESANLPSPYFQSPRLLNNTGEIGEFVLPLRVPSKKQEAALINDFTYPAASWTLTAHEARPGHELQFASMIENGVSQARSIFAASSVNVEGWGLYSESIVKPFMPVEGQLISLQLQLLRAARAFLDPELQAGKITTAEALKLLKEQVMLSDAFANQEVDRYTFKLPGQAASYFYGFKRVSEIRSLAEQALGKKFNQQKFHDFILSQGLLPPSLLEKAVVESFIKSSS
jgi:hypothetical protein